MEDRVARSPARLSSRNGKLKLCYYRRLEYDLLAFFFLLPCFCLRPYPGVLFKSSSCRFVSAAVMPLLFSKYTCSCLQPVLYSGVIRTYVFSLISGFYFAFYLFSITSYHKDESFGRAFFFGSSSFHGWRVCCDLVPGTLAFDSRLP